MLDYRALVIAVGSESVTTPLDRIVLANTFLRRLIGLLGRKALSQREGLLISPCPSIHTFFMRFSIDVVFLDEKYKVIGIAESVLPNRIRLGPKGTKHVLELADGNVKNTGLHLDQILVFD